MTRAVLQSRNRLTRLTERIAFPGQAVDRDAGLIKGVKVLGYNSSNDRTYLHEAVKRAAPLYEGCKVFEDHPEGKRQRRVSELVGRLVNVRIGEDGLYADLKIVLSHPMAERVLEAAENDPRLYGLSHNVDGRVERRAGKQVVVEITAVHSVDLVADPATTKGLYEGKTIASKRKISEAEMDDYGGEADMSATEPGAAPDVPEPAMDDDPLMAGFKSRIIAIFDSTDDWQTKKSMIGELLKLHDKAMNMGKEPAGVSEEEEEEEDDEDSKKESRQRQDTVAGSRELRELKEQVARSKRQEKALELCESLGVVPNKVLRLALSQAADEAEMRTLIREHKATSRNMYGRPRSQAQGQTAASGQTKQVTDGKSFASAITRRY